ncbi:hypothetical protein VTK56DRAFT_8081 [Thermocarpiscus australiensis]
MSIEEQSIFSMTSQKIPTKGVSPHGQQSPFKKRKAAITLAQKQALIDNLQLEITERARKLRANYSIHAQSLRTRIEIRVNRIPTSLRKLTMGDLLRRYSGEQPQKTGAATSTVSGPPVPVKDPAPSQPAVQRAPAATAQSSARPAKRPSHEISGGDKENEVEHVETPKKKARLNPTADVARNPGQVLSPTTSNSLMAPRERTAATPGRSGIARPAVTPGRTAAVATNILSNMAEKARSTRAGATAATTATRKPTTSTTTSSSTNGAGPTTTTTTTARRKRGATVTAAVAPPAAPPSRPATRTARRASGNSESSENSTSTVVRKRQAAAAAVERPATAPPGARPKPPAAATGRRTVMSTTRKAVAASGTATARKAAAGSRAAAAAASSGTASGTGRVLRKRG